MEIISVKLACCDQETAGLLQDLPARLALRGAIVVGSVDVQAQRCSETDGADDRVIGRSL